MSAFSILERQSALQRAAERVVDVVIVGAGITGTGVAREAALAGYDVLLVDKGDLASGTSSRSSKLIHGGVRYLEQGDVALVREAARERAVLRTIAPHLARPVRMLIPTASRRGRLKLAAGLWTFDRLAGGANEEPHEILDESDVLGAEKGLRRDRVSGGVAFTEYVTDDARLTLETAKSAAAAGASVATYAEVAAVENNGSGLRVVVEDHLGRAQLVVRTKSLVNAAGPWFDRVRGLHESGVPPLLQLTRGIHLVFRRDRLPVTHLVVLRAPDGRSVFIVPRGDYAYVGTTDTMYDGVPDEPGVSNDDACYLLESMHAALEDPPRADDVVGTWSGVRPLLAQSGKSASEISRRDEIRVGPGPIVSIAGGKLTTYRRMAERVIARLADILGQPPAVKVDSALLPLAGGDLSEQRRARNEAPRLGDALLEQRLWETYGIEAAGIVQRIHDESSSAEPVGGIAHLTVAELEHAVDRELVATLDDLLRRRSGVAMFDIEAAVAAAPAVARRLGARLGWSSAREREEVECSSRDRIAELATVKSSAARAAG